jgi:hypothetical protein
MILLLLLLWMVCSNTELNKDNCVVTVNNEDHAQCNSRSISSSTARVSESGSKELVVCMEPKPKEKESWKFFLGGGEQNRWNFWKKIWFFPTTTTTTSSVHFLAQHRKARTSPSEKGMVLEVYYSRNSHRRTRNSYWNFYKNQNEEDATSTTTTTTSTTATTQSDGVVVSYYELFEPVELELGRVQVHLVDYAYSPVLRSRNTGLIQVAHHAQPREQSLQESSTHGWGGGGGGSGSWWQWWLPWNMISDFSKHQHHHRSQYYQFQEAFAGGSHGEVWRGRRKCTYGDCNEALIFKRLKVETGYQALEAGLREVYFGSMLHDLDTGNKRLFTEYVEHFFGENDELWIVFKDAGASLSSFLYTGNDAGEYLIYEHSFLWTLIRMSLAKQNLESDHEAGMVLSESHRAERLESKAFVGRQLVGSFLRQILEAAAVLHQNGIVHRDIKVTTQNIYIYILSVIARLLISY